jgi:putative membrane protein
VTTAHLLLTAWEKDPFTLGLCLIGTVFYVAAFRSGLARRAGHFAAALVVFVLALASPIGVLARGYLFSAHMLQHLLLVLVVPPLVLLSLRASNADAPPDTGRWRGARIALMWVAGVGAMWLWHAPTLCNAASQSPIVQNAQTLSLLAMGGAFWWPMFGRNLAHRIPPFGAMLYLFTACIACTVLGILITFSPVEICSVFLHPIDRLGALPLLRGGWGLTPQVDQQVGGLLMWVPACMVYAIAILAMLARYYREADDDEPSEPVAPATAAAIVKEEA